MKGSAEDARLNGIRGWLIVPAIALAGTGAKYALAFAAGAGGLDRAIPDVRPLLMFETALNGVMLGFTVVVAVLFFRKRRQLPLVFMAWVVAQLVTQILELFVIRQFPTVWSVPEVRTQAQRGVLGGLLICSIWLPYFIKSRRVDATFVR
jgi:hypothetical protein